MRHVRRLKIPSPSQTHLRVGWNSSRLAPAVHVHRRIGDEELPWTMPFNTLSIISQTLSLDESESVGQGLQQV